MTKGPTEKSDPIARDSLTSVVYNRLRLELMEGRYWPGHRFKVRDLAASLRVSETPIREALMQLVRIRALELQSGRLIIVAHVSLDQYLEMRTVRLFLEGLAAEQATTRITHAEIDRMADYHTQLVAAHTDGRGSDALKFNWRFHHTLYEAAGLPEVLNILDDIWVRNGPLVNFYYPKRHHVYTEDHKHFHIIEHLRDRNPEKVREAVQADLMEASETLVQILKERESTPAPASPADFEPVVG